MAFPVVQGRSSGIQGSNSLTHPITMPTGIVAGELLVIVFSVDGNPTCTADGGFSKLGQASYSTTVTGAVFYKIAAGGDTCTITTGASEQSTHVVLRISGAANTPTGTSSNGSSTNSNPPLHTPVGGAKDFLWLATRSGDAAVVATAAPANYINLQTKAGGTSGASTNTAERSLNAVNMDPGVFTSVTEQWVCYTVSIFPAGAQTYDETAKLQVLLVAQGRVDVASLSEIAKAQTVLATQGELDGYLFNETGLTQSILASQGRSDQVIASETAKLTVVLATQGRLDSTQMNEVAKLALVLAPQGRSDSQIMMEAAKTETVLAVQGEMDGLLFIETGLTQVLLILQGKFEQLMANETEKAAVILAALGEADGILYDETAKQAMIFSAQGEQDIMTLPELGKEQIILALQGRSDTLVMDESALEEMLIVAQGQMDSLIPGTILPIDPDELAKKIAEAKKKMFDGLRPSGGKILLLLKGDAKIKCFDSRIVVRKS